MKKQPTAADTKMFELAKEEKELKAELGHSKPDSLAWDDIVSKLHDNYDYQRLLKPDLTLPLTSYYI